MTKSRKCVGIRSEALNIDRLLFFIMTLKVSLLYHGDMLGELIYIKFGVWTIDNYGVADSCIDAFFEIAIATRYR